MKKGIVLLLILAMVAAVFSGCSGSADNGLCADAFYTKTVLTLPLKTEKNEGDYLSYGGYSFTTGKNLSKLAKLVTKNNKDVTAEEFANAYGKCWLFTKNETGILDSWCLYQQDPANVKNMYIFSGMHRLLETEDGDMDLLLPLHLISDSYIRDNMGSRLTLGTPYACGMKKAQSSMAQLFREFYESSNLYTVSETEGGFTVVPTQGLALTLQFSFDEAEESGLFTITDETEREAAPTEDVRVSWQPSEDEDAVNVVLSSDDALALSTILIDLSFVETPSNVEYPYYIDVDGEVYMARLLWENDKWNGSVYYHDGTSALTTAQACIVAACMYNGGVLVMDASEDVVEYEPDVDEISLSNAMQTVTEVNLRRAPDTSGAIIKTMSEGDVVAVSGKVGDWYVVVYGTQIGYMNGDYMKPAI